MKTITLSKSEFLKKDSLEGLYNECKVWLSGIELCIVELKFTKSIFDQYFSDIATIHKLGELDLIEKELSNSFIKLNNAHTKIRTQEKQVFEIIENEFSHDEQAFRDQHEKLKETIESTQNEIKGIKKKVFSFTEETMRKKKKKEKRFIR